MEIRVLEPADAASCRDLRLVALREDPTAFSSSYEEERDIPLSRVAERLAPTSDNIVLGAFEDGALIAMGGLARERYRKLAHKGVIWGVYVTPMFRKRGVARRLLTEMIRQAESMPGLSQLNLGVNAANPAAIALYESVGFQRFGVERGFMSVDGVMQDEIHMSRSIAQA